MMQILLDLDDVICEFVPRVLEMYNADWGDDLVSDDITSWEFTQFVRPECGPRLYEYVDMYEFYDGLKEVDGAVDGIERLRAKHSVAIVSALQKDSKMSAWHKVQWLKRHGLGDLPLIFTKHKHLVNGDVLLDDGLHNVVGFGRGAVLFKRPWNSFGATWGEPAISTWPEFVRLIEDSR